MRGVDLVLAPSWEQEGFGLPVLEAMACGVPVVASEISAFRGFAGGAAVLVPFDRPDRFAAAAAELLGDRPSGGAPCDAASSRRLRRSPRRVLRRSRRTRCTGLRKGAGGTSRDRRTGRFASARPRRIGMSADVSLVLVTYRSSAVAPAAVASFRARGGTAGRDLRGDSRRSLRRFRARRRAWKRWRPIAWSCGRTAATRPASTPVSRQAPGARSSPGTPTSRFRRGRWQTLLTALDEGWDVVGPQFALAGFLFPPADLQTPGEQLAPLARGPLEDAAGAASFAANSPAGGRSGTRPGRFRCRRCRARCSRSGARRSSASGLGTRGTSSISRRPTGCAGLAGRWASGWRRRRPARVEHCGVMRRIRRRAGALLRARGGASSDAPSAGRGVRARGSSAARRPLDRSPTARRDGAPASTDGAGGCCRRPRSGFPAAGLVATRPRLMAALGRSPRSRRRPVAVSGVRPRPGAAALAGPWWWEGRDG